MDFDLPPDDDPRRLEGRAWLAAHPKPSGRQLHDAGYVVPHWPEPYGIDADPMHQLIIHEELRAAKVSGPANPIGIGWAAPTVMLAGTEEQKQRYLDPIFTNPGDRDCGLRDFSCRNRYGSRVNLSTPLGG